MTGGGKAIAAHSTVVLRFVQRLPEGCQTDDYVARRDMTGGDHLITPQSRRNGGIHDDGANEVAHIGRFASGAAYPDAHIPQRLQHFFGSGDNCRYHLAGYAFLVAAYRRGIQDVVDSANTGQVIDIHSYGILGDAFPNRHIAGFLPVNVSQRRFCAGAVGVYDTTVFRIAGKIVRDDFAKRVGEKTLVETAYGLVDIFLFSGNTPLPVAFFQPAQLGFDR